MDTDTDGGVLIAALNAEFDLPEQLNVVVEDCGVVNAFYDPQHLEIIMCTEFADMLADQSKGV